MLAISATGLTISSVAAGANFNCHDRAGELELEHFEHRYFLVRMDAWSACSRLSSDRRRFP